jgi:hypothetical protein
MLGAAMTTLVPGPCQGLPSALPSHKAIVKGWFRVSPGLRRQNRLLSSLVLPPWLGEQGPDLASSLLTAIMSTRKYARPPALPRARPPAHPPALLV